MIKRIIEINMNDEDFYKVVAFVSKMAGMVAAEGKGEIEIYDDADFKVVKRQEKYVLTEDYHGIKKGTIAYLERRGPVSSNSYTLIGPDGEAPLVVGRSFVETERLFEPYKG